MIIYDRLWKKMEREGIHRKDLITRKIISASTLTKLKKNKNVSTETVNKLCQYFNCMPNDIMEYLPNTKNVP